MPLGDFANNLLEKFTDHLHKPENKQWINQQILSPVASYIEGYLKPYFLTLLICLLAIVLLLLYNIRLMYSIHTHLRK
jgi:hypothetical protein